jgi:hypothetical protein
MAACASTGLPFNARTLARFHPSQLQPARRLFPEDAPAWPARGYCGATRCTSIPCATPEDTLTFWVAAFGSAAERSLTTLITLLGAPPGKPPGTVPATPTAPLGGGGSSFAISLLATGDWLSEPAVEAATLRRRPRQVVLRPGTALAQAVWQRRSGPSADLSAWPVCQLTA